MADKGAEQRDPDVVTFAGFVGVRNDVFPERFGPADLEAGDNVDIDNSGRVSRREGYTLRSAAATHSVWSDNDQIALCVQGTVLKRIATDYSLTTLKTGLAAGQRMRYTKVNDRVYFANSVDNGVLDNGVVRTWGLQVPPAVGVVANPAGSLGVGAYQVLQTYVRADGQESGAGLATKVAVSANSKLVFSFSAAPSDVAYRNVYLSPPNGDDLYLALTVPAASLAATYDGDAKELTYDLKTQFLSPPPVGHMTAYFNGRMYVAVDDVIYPSQPFAYELFDLRDYIPLSSRCTMIAALEDKEALDQAGQNSGLFIGTQVSCGILLGTKPEDFRYVPKVDYGAIEGALDFVDGTRFGEGSGGARRFPMWLTTRGVCVGLPGLDIRNLTESKYVFPAAGIGAAFFQPTSNRFVAVSNY